MEEVFSFGVFSVVVEGVDGLAAAVVFVVVIVFSLEVLAVVTFPEGDFVVTVGRVFSLDGLADADRVVVDVFEAAVLSFGPFVSLV